MKLSRIHTILSSGPNRVRIFRITVFVAGLLLTTHVSGQNIDIEPWFSSEIEVVDSLDPQKVICNAYRLGSTVIYDSPQFLRLYPDQYYHLKFRFRLFNGLQEIDHLNYRDQQYQLEIKPSNPHHFKINAISPQANGISVYGVSTAKTGDLAAFEVRLIDPGGQLAGNGNFDLVIPTQDLDVFYPNYMNRLPPDQLELLQDFILEDPQIRMEKFQFNSDIQLKNIRAGQLKGNN
ncbi:hypothetical protein [Flavilitoribacter nigricans]|uniref:Uncharacterized protein n=1 Tax=Flavilitoribacter nigricans (strain ATCC 23147 / DSM 23189 / NBRC 102662 / NCIMB 1420 / SS-2) TaxID=1122177 RepID=A0A2D0NBI2_FLAN2|nr:hypothetical protein [Flavilitoribacter nigricans]PHN05854.1 hypothetical protein CRP01_15400 [Flavilitoribacter nigricans DSM 23189 = NBRC 102662]